MTHNLEKPNVPKWQSRFWEVTVIIPTLNEEKNIGHLLTLISDNYPSAKVIIADDGSKDRTALIAKSYSIRNKNISLLDRRDEKVKGLCASVVDSVGKTSTKFVVVIDGDLQHPPEKIFDIVEKLKDYDIVGGSRNKVVSPWPLHRKLISKVATILARMRLGKKIDDPLSGFFGVKTAHFKNVLKKHGSKFEKTGYKVFFDLLKYSGGTKVGNVTYDFGKRHTGQSKIRMMHVLIFLRSLFK